MTENYTIVKGSFGYNLNFTLKDSAGSARNLSGYSVKLQVWEPLVPATLLVDTACTWTDATAGTCYYTIPLATTFATVGVFQYAVIPYVGSTVLDPALSGFITVTQYGGSYCTLEEVKRELGIDDNLKDDILQRDIAQAKQFIDDFCDRRFDTESATKYYDGDTMLFIDDLLTVTTLKTDEDGDGTYENTFAATDYILYPRNEYPKTYIKINPNGSYGGFAAGILNGVEIAGTWGYATTVPQPVRRAAIIQVCRWFKRKDSAYQDVVGSADTGTVTVYKGLDPDIELILDSGHYKKIAGC